jgi:rubrerythrin
MKNFNSIRDILNFAIEEELQAKTFYEKLADCVKKQDVKTAVKQFALDELRHKMRLEGVRDGDVMLRDEEIGSLGVADSLRDVKPHAEMTYKELLAYAVKKEQQAFGFYSQLAKSAKAPIIREMFTHLAQEEAEHKLKLEIEYDLT